MRALPACYLRYITGTFKNRSIGSVDQKKVNRPILSSNHWHVERFAQIDGLLRHGARSISCSAMTVRGMGS